MTTQLLLNDAKAKGVNIYLPVDTIAASAFANDATIQTCDITKIPDGFLGLDIGPISEKIFEKINSGNP